MEQKTYQDKLILELRRKYRQKQPDTLVGGQKEWKRIPLPGGFLSMMLPAYMHDMGQRERWIKYRSFKHPDVVLTDGDADATFTFSLAGQAVEIEEPAQRLEGLRKDMQKIWKQAVFYDMGTVVAGEVSIPWMDCKTFCLNGSLYCLLFLLEIQGQLILGNFHCSFPQYDRWKPMVLRLLQTVEEEGGYHERLPVKDGTVCVCGIAGCGDP